MGSPALTSDGLEIARAARDLHAGPLAFHAPNFGYLWFRTEDGLACYCLRRFDQQGRRMESMPIDASTDGEALSKATGLQQGSMCELWVGTYFVAKLEADGTVQKRR